VTDPLAEPTERATEAWFVHRGLPHFIDRYSAREDVLTRAWPLLATVFFLEMFGALNFDWPAWLNVAAVGGGLVLLLGGWALTNRARGRPLLSRPDQIGPVEVGAFVLLPAALPLVFGGQLGSAAGTAVTNTALLALVFGVTSYGLVPMTRWALNQVVAQLGTVTHLVARAVPLLLLFTTFLFINAEVWQVGSSLDFVSLLLVILVFFLAGTGFLVSRIPTEVAGVMDQGSAGLLADLVDGTPVAGLIGPDDPVPVDADLSRSEWVNVVLVLLFAKGVQVALVGGLVGLFFIAFGVLTVTESTVLAWTGSVDVLTSMAIAGREVAVTAELLMVSAFLAGFSAFYFAVYLVTDETYRREFFNDVVDDLHRSLGVRAVYLAARQPDPLADPR